MLKQRVITASVLALVFIAVLFISPWLVFTLLIGGVLLVGAWEWSNLSGLTDLSSRSCYVVAVLIASGVLVWATSWTENTQLFAFLLLASCVWWLFSLVWIRGFPASSDIWGSVPARLIMGLFVLIPAWLSYVYIRKEPSGAWLVLFLVLLVSAADIGAYFTGRAIGRRKLAPAVSPGKSWEGVFGGAVFAMIIAVLFNALLGGEAWLSLFIVVVPTALVSVVGDLLESMIKRHRGVKDSSQLLPGHGGVLDRIDGLVAATPVFALTLMASHWQL